MSFGKRKGGGRRRAERRTAPLRVLAATMAKTYEATLMDLSTSGAQLRAADLPAIGELLELTIEQVHVFGCVAWLEGNKCGIRFDEPLTPENVAVTRQKASFARGLPPELQGIHEEWTVGTVR